MTYHTCDASSARDCYVITLAFMPILILSEYFFMDE